MLKQLVSFDPNSLDFHKCMLLKKPKQKTQHQQCNIHVSSQMMLSSLFSTPYPSPKPGLQPHS